MVRFAAQELLRKGRAEGAGAPPTRARPSASGRPVSFTRSDPLMVSSRPHCWRHRDGTALLRPCRREMHRRPTRHDHTRFSGGRAPSSAHSTTETATEYAASNALRGQPRVVPGSGTGTDAWMSGSTLPGGPHHAAARRQAVSSTVRQTRHAARARLGLDALRRGCGKRRPAALARLHRVGLREDAAGRPRERRCAADRSRAVVVGVAPHAGHLF